MKSFSIQLKVRDYECDIQGIVNNSVYMNYFEHGRHEYMLHKGLDFHEEAKKGVNLVVIRAELDYKAPLRSGDEFVVETIAVKESRIKVCFKQAIYRLADEKMVIRANTYVTALNSEGRPNWPDHLDRLLVYEES